MNLAAMVLEIQRLLDLEAAVKKFLSCDPAICRKDYVLYKKRMHDLVTYKNYPEEDSHERTTADAS